MLLSKADQEWAPTGVGVAVGETTATAGAVTAVRATQERATRKASPVPGTGAMLATATTPRMTAAAVGMSPARRRTTAIRTQPVENSRQPAPRTARRDPDGSPWTTVGSMSAT